MPRTRPWEVSDELWERVAPLIPERPAHPKGGRPAADDQQMFAAIVYVLRTGIQWNALPRELGASSTVYDRFRWWEEQGFFQRLWQAGLQEYDELAGIGWDWQSLDSSTVKAPFAQAAVGPAPTDRGKQGTKRSLLCDRRGIPLALVIEGANRHDMKLVSATLDAQGYERPEPTMEQPHNLCLDAGYDYDPVYGDLYLRGYEPHARLNPHNHKWYQEALKRHPPESEAANSLEPTKQPRRWVVERLFSWLNRSRRLLIRWEKLSAPYEAFLKLACALICFHQSDRLSVFG
jgi:putative transposase